MPKFLYVLFLLIIPLISYTQFGTEKYISQSVGFAIDGEAVDIDNDGDKDIIVVMSNEERIVLFENIGNGTFSSAQTIVDYVDEIGSIAVADFDGDGLIDLVAGQWGKLSRYKNMGNGVFSFQQFTTDSNTACNVITSDIDNDGDQDIVSTSQSIRWHKNNGFGVFTIVLVQSGASTSNTVARDLDNDGDKDILSYCMQAGSNGLKIYQNNSNTSFSLISQPNASPTYGTGNCESEDVDGDGLFDLIASGLYGISWYKNLGGNILGTEQIIENTSAMGSFEIIDIENDGDKDVIIINNQNLITYVNQGGTFVFSQSFLSNSKTLSSIGSADFDSDGDQDLILTDGKETRVSRS